MIIISGLMREFLVLLVLGLPMIAWAGFAQLPNRICPLDTRNQLLPCVEAMDGNADGNITATEIDTFMLGHSGCIPAAVRGVLTGANIMTLCDVDLDGYLTLADWNAANGCIQARSRQMALCRACERCGFFVIAKKK